MSFTLRYELIQKKAQGEDPLVDLILAKDPTVFPVYEKARSFYNSAIKKSYIESCLLATQDLSRIEDLLSIPIRTIEVYRDIFFNLKDFDKLSLLEAVSKAATPDERGMKMWALSQGLDFIAWRLGKQVNISPIAGLQDLFTTSMFKSKEALFSGNSSDNSREATKWTKLSMDLARLLKAWVMDSNEAKSDLQIALGSISPEFPGFDKIIAAQADEEPYSEDTSAEDTLGLAVGPRLNDDSAFSLGSIDDVLDIPPLPSV